MYKIFLGGINADSPESSDSDLSFSNRLRNAGFLIVTNPLEAQFVICVDQDKHFKIRTRKAKFLAKRSILVRNEPVVVCPNNKLSRTESRFGLSLNMRRPSSTSENVVAWPQQWPAESIVFNSNLSREEKIVLVNGNKISFVTGEMYSLRREAIAKIEFLDFYGTSWDLSIGKKTRHFLANLFIAIQGGYFPRISGARFYFTRFTNWKGAPINKRMVLSNYKYCLVIENSTEFMTEKLFDALFAGCIPIYVGPDLKNFSIPKYLYFQAKPNLKSIKESIIEARKIDYLSWRIGLSDWLNLESTKEQWSSEEVNSRVIRTIEQYCQKVI